MPSKVMYRWYTNDTIKRLDRLNGGCKTIEEAKERYPNISFMSFRKNWENGRMGLSIYNFEREIFDKIHARWREEQRLNGSVRSKV
jgi:hypothetical protein